MWIVKSAYTDQTTSIKKLLQDDFEPFAVVEVKVKNRSDRLGATYKPVSKLRMYFRKSPLAIVDEDTYEVERKKEIREIVEQFVEASKPAEINLLPLQNLANEFGSRLASVLNDFITEFKETFPPTHAELISFPTEMNDNEINYKKRHPDIPENIELDENPSQRLTEDLADRKEVDEGEFLSPEDFGVKREAPSPAGESFRVVDDVPEISSSRSEAQDEMIEKIRGKHQGANLSIFNVSEGVKVMVEDQIYTILQDGKFKQEDNKANRSSIIVER